MNKCPTVGKGGLSFSAPGNLLNLRSEGSTGSTAKGDDSKRQHRNTVVCEISLRLQETDLGRAPRGPPEEEKRSAATRGGPFFCGGLAKKSREPDLFTLFLALSLRNRRERRRERIDLTNAETTWPEGRTCEYDARSSAKHRGLDRETIVSAAFFRVPPTPSSACPPCPQLSRLSIHYFRSRNQQNRTEVLSYYSMLIPQALGLRIRHAARPGEAAGGSSARVELGEETARFVCFLLYVVLS